MATKVVHEFDWGIFVALDSDGKYIVNEDRDHLCIQGTLTKKHEAIAALRIAAKEHGFDNIKVEFRSGARLVTQSEYEDQVARQEAGLLADPFDPGALKDDIKRLKSGN